MKVKIFFALLSAAYLMIQGVSAEERSLKIRHTHTNVQEDVTFKRNGKYVPEGLSRLNLILADWRNGKKKEIDPALFDLIWEIYEEVGATEPVNVVSSYRTAETNEMLRDKSSGVAENSQHTHGKAMDFFIPGVKLDVLRAAAIKRQGGGVGYYPNSGSPFVHIDTGSVRAWPRMTTAQLKKIFPDGKTSHLPSDGPALKKEEAVVKVAEVSAPQTTAVADMRPRRKTLMDILFKKKDEAAIVDQRTVMLDNFPVQRPEDLKANRIDIAAVTLPTPLSERPVMESLTSGTTMLGYAPATSVAKVEEDPFGFVNLIPVKVTKRSEKKITAESLMDPILHYGMQFSSSGSSLHSPKMDSIRFLISPT